jgi:hypothetical protein
MEAETPKNTMPMPMNPQLIQAWGAVSADVQRAIDEETRKAVLEATRQFLTRVDVKALDEMRKSLDLPPEALGALIEIHAKKLAESEMPHDSPRASREVLPLSTGVRVKPGQSAKITARPQRVAFRPERFFVSDSGSVNKGSWWKRLWPWYSAPQSKGASDWIINDILIGHRSQFAQSGDIPADMFRSNAIDSFVSFETAQTAMDVSVVATYIGSNPKGEVFYASMVGTAAV